MNTYDDKIQELVQKAEACEQRMTEIRNEWIEYYRKDRERHIRIAPWYERKHMRMWTKFELEALADNACKTDRQFKSASGDMAFYMQKIQMYRAAKETQSGTVSTPVIGQQRRGGSVHPSPRT